MTCIISIRHPNLKDKNCQNTNGSIVLVHSWIAWGIRNNPRYPQVLCNTFCCPVPISLHRRRSTHNWVRASFKQAPYFRISRIILEQRSQKEGMFAAVEHGPVLCSDSNILCLSWKGRVPKSEKEKPVCRRRYYEEGWLATGNGRGVVGVTFTSSHCRRDRPTPQRINFNLRGHNSEVK